MSDAIGLREFNEAGCRKSIRTLSDEELLKAGSAFASCVAMLSPRHRARSTDNLKFAGKNIGADIRNDLGLSFLGNTGRPVSRPPCLNSSRLDC